MVNGALEYLAKDLGIVENTVLQGKELLFVYSFINESLFVASLRAPCFAGRLPEFNSMKQRMPFAKLVKQRCFGLLDMAAVLCLFFCLFNWPFLGCL